MSDAYFGSFVKVAYIVFSLAFSSREMLLLATAGGKYVNSTEGVLGWVGTTLLAT
jgi:hypothetical protein